MIPHVTFTRGRTLAWHSKAVAPVQNCYGNLHFSPYGVYAYWILVPPDKPLANNSRLAMSALAHKRLTEVLPFRPRFAATSSLKDPRFIYDQMARDVDLAAHPYYQQVCLGRMYEAEGSKPRFPVFWMWVRLRPKGRAASPIDAVRERLSHAGFLAPKPTAEALEAYWDAMLEMEDRIPIEFAPLRPNGSQIRWLWQRQQTLGVLDTPVPLPEYSDSALAGYRWEPQIDLDEGDGTKAGQFSPMLRVTSYDDGEKRVSYQIHAAVTSFPAGGIYFPGSNFTSLISNVYDRVSRDRVAIDWSQSVDENSLGKANRKNERTHPKLDEQWEQQEGRRGTTELREAQAALAEYDRELSVGVREAEVKFTTIFSIGAQDPAAVRRGYKALQDELEEVRVQIAAPVGKQISMYQATRPGVEDLSIDKSFVQYTTRTGWTRYIPVSSSRFGDTQGRVIGWSKMSADMDVVMMDDRGEARRVQSGGVIIGGDPRKGKTHFGMANLGERAISGAFVLVFDGSMQWTRFGSVVPGAGYWNPAEGRNTVDPLLTVGGQEGAELLTNELCRILQLDINSDRGTKLRLLIGKGPSSVETPKRSAPAGLDAARHGEPAANPWEQPEPVAWPTWWAHDEPAPRWWRSAADLMNFLTSPACPDVLKPVGEQLDSWCTTRTAEAIFGRLNPETGLREPLAPVALRGASMLVVQTQDLNLPSKGEVLAAATGDQPLGVNQMIGQAVINLFTAYARKVFYGRQSMDIIAFDEGWRLENQKPLQDIVFEIFRTGPAANIDCYLISQKPWDEFADMDVDLARVRVMYTVEDEIEAVKATRWMGIDPVLYPNIPECLSIGLSPRTRARDAFHRTVSGEVVDRDRMGECLIRMGDGDHGWIKANEMVFPEWEQMADTRPQAT